MEGLIIGNIPQYLMVSVICTVIGAEILKRALKNTKLGKALSGFYFVYPVIFSVITVLAVYIGGQNDLSWKSCFNDILTVYGTSVLSYEAIVKRLFGKIDKGEVNDKDSVNTVPADTSSDSSLSSSDQGSEEDSSKSSVDDR